MDRWINMIALSMISGPAARTVPVRALVSDTTTGTTTTTTKAKKSLV